MEAYSKEMRRDVLAACDAGEGTCPSCELHLVRAGILEALVKRFPGDHYGQRATTEPGGREAFLGVGNRAVLGEWLASGRLLPT